VVVISFSVVVVVRIPSGFISIVSVTVSIIT